VVPLEVAGITAEILPGPELRRVHEEAYDDEIVLGARAPHEREVPFVEKTHRGYKPNARAVPAGAVGAAAHRLDFADDIHF